MSGNPIERTKNLASRFAISMLKRPRLANGGVVTGPLLGVDGGRTDSLPITVPEGAYVIPADVVSGIPSAQGNSLAGHNALNKLFSSLPLLPDEAPYGATSPALARAHTIPGLSNTHHLMQQALAKGGSTGKESKERTGQVPILAAAGEYVVHPVYVKRLGLGKMKRGHEILDRFVEEVRNKNIKTLTKLPKPVKN